MSHGEIYAAIFWGAIVCFVLIGSYFKYKSRESEHRFLERLAEKGQQLTPDLLASVARDDRGKGGAVRGGIILMGIGVGLAVFLWAMTGGGGLFQGDTGAPNWLPTVGAIPFMIGVAMFLTSFIDRKPPK